MPRRLHRGNAHKSTEQAVLPAVGNSTDEHRSGGLAGEVSTESTSSQARELADMDL